MTQFFQGVPRHIDDREKETVSSLLLVHSRRYALGHPEQTASLQNCLSYSLMQAHNSVC